jgi:hypothetical protein
MPEPYRIFQIISGSANNLVPQNRTWYRNLHEPLVEMGHDVFLFSADQGEWAMTRKDGKLRAAFSQRLFETYQREHRRRPFDLVFAYLKEGMVEPGAIKEIGRTGTPTCNFSCNNTHQFHLVERLSPLFDFSLHSEKDAREKFVRVGAHPVWWPMASNPKYFKPQRVQKTVDVSFVGANYGLRARYVLALLRAAVDVHVYGPGWQGGSRTRLRSFLKRYVLLAQSLWAPGVEAQTRASARLADHDLSRLVSKRFPSRVHPSVSDDELIRLYSKSQISLGCLEVYDRHDPSRGVLRHLHLREFEAPMCGALYCTGYSDELAEMFEPEQEVVTYRNEGELLSKVRYYLNHEAEGERIRRAARQRALRDHTYERRFHQLFRQIGLG